MDVGELKKLLEEVDDMCPVAVFSSEVCAVRDTDVSPRIYELVGQLKFVDAQRDSEGVEVCRLIYENSPALYG